MPKRFESPQMRSSRTRTRTRMSLGREFLVMVLNACPILGGGLCRTHL